jgi:predicted O-methyltransferase YrrM
MVQAVILTAAVSSYLETLQAPADEVLAEMQERGRREGIPIVVPETGALLHVLARALAARRIVEVGTAIGVSTLYLARAVDPGGTVISFEVDAERHALAEGYLARAGVGDRTDLRLQDAREGLASLKGAFDFAFIDGVKAQYGDYLGQLLPLLRPGAVLTVDNVLMSGTVAEGRTDGHWTDEQISQMRAFTQHVLSLPELTGSVLPVGDGVLVAVRS